MKEHTMNLRLGLRSSGVPGEQPVRGSLDLCGFTAQSKTTALFDLVITLWTISSERVRVLIQPPCQMEQWQSKRAKPPGWKWETQQCQSCNAWAHSGREATSTHAHVGRHRNLWKTDTKTSPTKELQIGHDICFVWIVLQYPVFFPKHITPIF